MGAVSYFYLLTKSLTLRFDSVEGEWIVARKDWQEAKRRAKSRERRERKEKERGKPVQQSTDSASEETSDTGYTPDMDEQRCILYLHGGERVASICGLPFPSDRSIYLCPVGGYYFGSVDQERYSIQRFARKMNGRVFGECCSYRILWVI